MGNKEERDVLEKGGDSGVWGKGRVAPLTGGEEEKIFVPTFTPQKGGKKGVVVSGLRWGRTGT